MSLYIDYIIGSMHPVSALLPFLCGLVPVVFIHIGRYCAINSAQGSGWGRNPETGGRVIFAPTEIPTAHVVSLLSHTLFA